MKDIKKTVKRSVSSDPEKILRVVEKKWKDAVEIRADLKDRFGYNLKPDRIRIGLLRLLRQRKIERKKFGKVYKYRRTNQYGSAGNK